MTRTDFKSIPDLPDVRDGLTRRERIEPTLASFYGDAPIVEIGGARCSE